MWIYKRSDVKDNPVNVDERVKKIFKKVEVSDLVEELHAAVILILLRQTLFGEVP